MSHNYIKKQTACIKCKMLKQNFESKMLQLRILIVEIYVMTGVS